MIQNKITKIGSTSPTNREIEMDTFLCVHFNENSGKIQWMSIPAHDILDAHEKASELLERTPCKIVAISNNIFGKTTDLNPIHLVFEGA